MKKRTFLLLSISVVLLAFALREWYALASTVVEPARGDVGSYLRYARHLLVDGVFSQSMDGRAVVPDAFRGPGYPVFLAAILKLSGEAGWYPAVYQAQAVVGALTVAGVIALARQWMPYSLSLLAGLLIAVWPHHIVATNAMLIEVVFGFAIVASLLLAALALSRRSMGLAVAAGAAFGAAYLVNPVIALFPAVLLVVFWRAGSIKLGAVVLSVSLVAAIGWGVRNAAVDAHGDDRAAINLVQGAWPEYHDAWEVYAKGYPSPELVKVDAEIALMSRDRDAGIHSIAHRFASDPLRFAAWYGLQKPYDLWSWSIRIGWGEIYTLEVVDSPLDGALAGVTALAWVLNPLLFALALLGAVISLRGAPASVAGLFFLYITAVHVIFQAEPRYAIAYRPVEMMMAASCLSVMLQAYRRWRDRSGAILLDKHLVHP